MASFSFKKEVDVRVVHGGTQYKIDINEIEFGQTFQEKSFEVKTLHNQGSFEGSVINQANPAEFSLNTPLLRENTHRVIFDRLLDSATFDIYISTQSNDVWKLDTCVIQDGTFEINKSRPLRLAISGEASKLSKHSGAIPGSTPSATTTTYIVPTITTLTLGSDDISDSVLGLSVELQNDINWNNYNTIHGAVTATDAANSMYPTTFTSGTKVLGGTIVKYLKDDSTSVLTWNNNTSLVLEAAVDLGKTVASIATDSGGTGYSSPPEVTITGGGGSGATATAVIDSGAVQSINVTNPGIGYITTPTVTIATPPGGGIPQTATATATLSAAPVRYGVKFNITNCSFTNRMSAQDVFREEYNWRMTQNPTALSSVITYTTA